MAEPTACSAGSSPARSPRPASHEDDVVIAIRDIAPRAPTHILVMPREHIASAADLTEADGPMLGRLFAVAAEIARAGGIADGGYRLVTNVGRWGGQTVDHLHFHLMGGRAFDWPPGMIGSRAPAPRRARRRSIGRRRRRGARVAGCGDSATATSPPSAASTRPGMTVTPTVARTRAELVRALGERQPRRWPTARRPSARPRRRCSPRRRAPSTRSSCPRPDQGFIVVYEFARSGACRRRGRGARRRYLATGPGRVQFAAGDACTSSASVGSTVVIYDWLPGAAHDPRRPDRGRARDDRDRLPGRDLRGRRLGRRPHSAATGERRLDWQPPIARGSGRA